MLPPEAVPEGEEKTVGFGEFLQSLKKDFFSDSAEKGEKPNWAIARGELW